MDIVALLTSSAAALPNGNYSTGLNAIVRHVEAAIRHLERDPTHDPDTCTDAIYRTNQAYEGSLKEAYRVLADKDPSGLTPYNIELYLENNNIVRPRVLTQLARYRQDYRNPSTHDYKLDFDADEALLAIVSVCAFAKLLINQIGSKIAANAAEERVKTLPEIVAGEGDISAILRIAKACLAFTAESANVGWFEYEKGIANSIVAIGYDANVEQLENSSSKQELWDVWASADGARYAIDTRVPPGDVPQHTLNPWLLPSLIDIDGFDGVILIYRSMKERKYVMYQGTYSGKLVYFITVSDDDQSSELAKMVPDLRPCD